MAERGNEGADGAGDLRPASGRRLAAPQDAREETGRTRCPAIDRGLAGTRGAGAQRAARPHYQGRRPLRDRPATAQGRAGPVAAAGDPQGLGALVDRRRPARRGQRRAGHPEGRAAEAAETATDAGRHERGGRTAQGAAAPDRRTRGRRRQGAGIDRRHRPHRRRGREGRRAGAQGLAARGVRRTGAASGARRDRAALRQAQDSGVRARRLRAQRLRLSRPPVPGYGPSAWQAAPAGRPAARR